MAHRYSIHDVSMLHERTFFFDTNVLMYLYYPNTQAPVSPYSRLFAEMLKQKVRMCVDIHVVSEFVNSVVRIDCKNSGLGIGFKQYRNSPQGQVSVTSAYKLMETILKQFVFEDNALFKADVEALLTVDSLDFNDKLIENLCANKGFILVTNDRDFKCSNIDILTMHNGF